MLVDGPTGDCESGRRRHRERRFRGCVEGGHCEVRVQDTQGLLAANPAADDSGIWTSHGRALSIPGLVTGRGATGRMMAVVVQPRLPATILVSSAAFGRADDKGNALGSGVTQIPVSSGSVVTAATASATAPRVVTVEATRKK